MDRIPIADLEAELGCIFAEEDPNSEQDSPPVEFYEPPSHATSRLMPKSKTKTVYPFGDGQNMAWATPAGELIQFASCIDKKLIAVEAKASLKFGEEYYNRAKSLQRAVKSPQGSGFGLGITIDMRLDDPEVFWVHNKWPRFNYQNGDLDIQIQYCFTSRTLVQQLQFRNRASEDISIPYTTGFDVSFRKHASSEPPNPVASSNISERLMLFRNSTLLVQSASYGAQLESSFFQNKRRQAIWLQHEEDNDSLSNKHTRRSSEDSSIGGLENYRLKRWQSMLERDFSLHSRLGQTDDQYYRAYYRTSGEENASQTDPQPNFTSHSAVLKVPPSSTMELCLVFKISPCTSQLRSKTVPPPWEPFRIAHHLKDPTKTLAEDKNRLRLEKSLQKQEVLLEDKELVLSSILHSQRFSRRDRQATDVVEARIALGKSYVEAEDIGQARFHFFLATLIASKIFSEDSREVCEARLTYIKFLYANNWSANAWTLIEKPRAAQDLDIRHSVDEMLAAMHAERGNFIVAGKIYQQLYSASSKPHKQPNAKVAGFLERLAWAQASRGKCEDACNSYEMLRDTYPSTSQKKLLSNLAFLKRRMGQISEAKRLFQSALDLAEDTPAQFDADLFARSGLYNTLTAVSENTLAATLVPQSMLPYLDLSVSLDSIVPNVFAFENLPMSFAILRHLEYQLCLCSVDVRDSGDGSPCIAFVDGDPLNSCTEAIGSYYQFRFLLQCWLLLEAQSSTKGKSESDHSYRQYMDRIEAVLTGHLNWVFTMVKLEGTWMNQYPIDGDPDYEKNNFRGNTAKPRPLAGAYHFLKLYDFCCVFTAKQPAILPSVIRELHRWLTYLSVTKHKSNLWVADDTLETFWLRDLKSGDNRDLRVLFPVYDLASSVTLWLTLVRMEKLIRITEARLEGHGDSEDPLIDPCDLRTFWGTYREKLKSITIPGGITRTFLFSQEQLGSASTNEQDDGRMDLKTKNELTSSPIKATFSKPLFQEGRKNSIDVQSEKIDSRLQYFAFRRSAKSLQPYIGPDDGFVLEAACNKLFEALPGDALAAWNETLKLQQDIDPSTFEDPRSYALALLARRHGIELTSRESLHGVGDYCSKLEGSLYDFGAFAQALSAGGTPEQMTSWSALTFQTMSYVMSGLFEECRDISPRLENLESQLSPSRTMETLPKSLKSRVTRRLNLPSFEGRSSGQTKINYSNIIDDASFLPDWMYFYPDFLHNETLKIQVNWELNKLNSGEMMQPAVARWKKAKDARKGKRYSKDGRPEVIDLGMKKAVSTESADSLDRKVDVKLFKNSKEVFDFLTQPRTAELAKKRLVELPYCSAESALPCWLSASTVEKPLLLEFFRRHTNTDNYFGEWAHQLCNIWETEFHLAFYQFVDSPDLYRKRSSKLLGRPELRKLPSFSTTDPSRMCGVAALGFRFVGDLRDRFWTCHLATHNYRKGGFADILNDQWRNWSDKHTKKARFLHEKLNQRKVLEATYIDRMTSEMKLSVGEILDSMDSESRMHELRDDPQNESFELTYNRSRLAFQSKELLRDIGQRQELAINTITEWENREETRGIRSRWTKKDEERFGEKIRELSRQIRINTQELKSQRNRIQDLLRQSEHRHTDLLGYMQLREARTSTRSAEDVRLFTYVTIIFLPLSFSSSLFSMAGPPDPFTIVVMVQVTVIALAITLLFLANMKLLDRYWTFWANSVNTDARKKMKQSYHKWPIRWNRVSKQLNEAAERQLSKTDYERKLPAESRWWYFWFWLSYLLVEIPSAQVSNAIAAWKVQPSNKFELIFKSLVGLAFTPICFFIFVIQFSFNAAIDMAKLFWAMGHQWEEWLVHPEKAPPRQVPASEKEEGKDSTPLWRGAQSYGDSTSSSSDSSAKLTGYDKNRKVVFRRLNKPPRPLKKYVKALAVRAKGQPKVEQAQTDNIISDSNSDEEASLSDLSFISDDDRRRVEEEGNTSDSNRSRSSKAASVAPRSEERSDSEEQEPPQSEVRNVNSSSTEGSSINWLGFHRALFAPASSSSQAQGANGSLPV